MFQNILSDDFFFKKQKFLLAYHPIFEKIISKNNMINTDNTPLENTESLSKKPPIENTESVSKKSLLRKDTRTSFLNMKPKDLKVDHNRTRHSIQIDLQRRNTCMFLII
jgi:hypothetical protein